MLIAHSSILMYQEINMHELDLLQDSPLPCLFFCWYFFLWTCALELKAFVGVVKTVCVKSVNNS